jgi:uncharacterized protein YlzI (FlbEa/FlbD family)
LAVRRGVPSGSLEVQELMIHLTRLNNAPLVVNADLIKFIERAPDTVITLITGEKLVVRESAAEVLERISEFHQQSAHRIVFGLSKDSKPDEKSEDNGRRSPPSEFADDEKS